MTATNIRKVGVVATLLISSILILLPTFVRSGLPEWWPSKAIKLGLDLKGGIYLVLGVETEEALKSALNGIGNALKAELRKDKVGVLRARSTADKTLEITLVSAAGVSSLEDRIQKEYPQLTKIESSGEGSGGQVKVVYKMKPNDANELERNSVEQAIETIRNRVDQFGVSEPQIQRAGEKRIIVQLPDVTDLEQVKKTIGSVAKLEFRLVADPTKGSGSTETFPLKEGGEIRVEDEVVMSGDSIEKAFVEIDPSLNSANVSLKLTPTGAKIFDNVT